MRRLDRLMLHETDEVVMVEVDDEVHEGKIEFAFGASGVPSMYVVFLHEICRQVIVNPLQVHRD